MVALVDIVEGNVECRGNIQTVGGEVEQHYAIVGSRLAETFLIALVVVQFDVEQSQLLGNDGVGGEEGCGAVAQEQVLEVCGARIHGAVLVECVSHCANDAEVGFVGGVEYGHAAYAFIDNIVGYDAGRIAEKHACEFAFEQRVLCQFCGAAMFDGIHHPLVDVHEHLGRCGT